MAGRRIDYEGSDRRLEFVVPVPALLTPDPDRLSLGAGDVLFRQGEPGDLAFVIESGRVDIEIETGGGCAIIASLGPGELVGEMALIDDSVRSATARAVETTELLAIRRAQILKRVDEAEPVLRLLLTTLLNRFRNTQRQLATLRAASLAPLAVAPAPEPATLAGTADGAAEAVRGLKAEVELSRALSNREFEPVFQPIVRLRDRALAGFEALVRWRHPDRGMVPPGEFISVAERTGLIRDVDLQVLNEAWQRLRVVCARLPAGAPLPFLSSNLSAHHFRDGRIVAEVRAVVEALQLDPGQMKVEITESVLIQDPDQAQILLGALKDMGVRIALDDFGTGFSSLSYLHRFPFDTLKIDRSFLLDVHSSRRSFEVVRAITVLAQAVGMQVIAEGVETEEVARVLAELGCDFGQGWLFGRPQPDSELPRLLGLAEPAKA